MKLLQVRLGFIYCISRITTCCSIKLIKVFSSSVEIDMSLSEETVKIDGSLGEGGGQVLRVALCLSALYKIQVEINNIRAGRPKPGLSAQHLKGVELIKDLCNAKVTGAEIGSTYLSFKPGLGENKKNEFYVDIKTAGCISLLIQVALPCALFSSRSTTYILKGGTNVPFGPQIEYCTNVFRHLLNKFGGDFELDIVRRGYYPRGGGEVYMKVNPVYNLRAVQLLDSGTPQKIEGWSFAAGSVNLSEANKMADDAKSIISQELAKCDYSIPFIDIKTYKEPSNKAIGNGSGINIICTTSKDCIFGGSGLGSNRAVSIRPGVEAGNQVMTPILIDACVDEHLQDQMIILMVLAKGVSKVKIGKRELTCHAKTAKEVAEIMLGKKGLSFKLCRDEKNSYILECNGLGLYNEFLK